MRENQIYKQVDQRPYLVQGEKDEKFYYWDALYLDVHGPFDTLEQAEKGHSAMCEGHYGEGLASGV